MKVEKPPPEYKGRHLYLPAQKALKDDDLPFRILAVTSAALEGADKCFMRIICTEKFC